MSFLARLIAVCSFFSAIQAFAADVQFVPDHSARFRFEGFAGGRINVQVENWLLSAPTANPGMLEIFQVRDREPKPNLVPWAGERAA